MSEPNRPRPWGEMSDGAMFVCQLLLGALIAGLWQWGAGRVFDVFFFWMFGYAAGSWIALTPDERARYREAVKAGLAAADARLSATNAGGSSSPRGGCSRSASKSTSSSS